MFRSLKVKKRWVILIPLLCLLIFVVLSFLASRASAPDTVVINGDEVPLGISGDDDAEAFLRLCGYEPTGIISDREITVPVIWNDVYTAYQDLQLSQGLDLVPYKGKQAREVVFGCGDEYVTLLISGERIIAAHKYDENRITEALTDQGS